MLPFLLIWQISLAIFVPSAPPPVSPGRGAMLALHITMGILGYAAFALSFILSIIFILQSRILRERRPGRTFWRFPPLDVLNRMSRSSVWVGLAASSLSLVLGFVWDKRVNGFLSWQRSQSFIHFCDSGALRNLSMAGRKSGVARAARSAVLRAVFPAGAVQLHVGESLPDGISQVLLMGAQTRSRWFSSGAGGLQSPQRNGGNARADGRSRRSRRCTRRTNCA